MRYTLSVLTAACLMALGQPAWSECVDRELLKRVRMATMALPDSDRAIAAVLLHSLQASVTAPPTRRDLPFSPIALAIQQVLQQRYSGALQAHRLPTALVVKAHELRAGAKEFNGSMTYLDPAMVAHWADVRV